MVLRGYTGMRVLGVQARRTTTAGDELVRTRPPLVATQLTLHTNSPGRAVTPTHREFLQLGAGVVVQVGKHVEEGDGGGEAGEEEGHVPRQRGHDELLGHRHRVVDGGFIDERLAGHQGTKCKIHGSGQGWPG